MKWHFSKRIEKILPIIGKKPFYCPLCPFMGKDRQCVVRHYTGKHQALDVWMAEFLDAVTYKTLTEDTLDTVENVDILGKLGELQKPFRGKIVNTKGDLKDFLDVSYESPAKNPHKCDQCNETFPSNSALKSHTLIDHNTKSRYERDLTARSEVIRATGVQHISPPTPAAIPISITPISITPTTTPIQPDLYRSKRLRNRLEKEQVLEQEESKKEVDAALRKVKEMDIQQEKEKHQKVLILEDEVGGGLRCLTCSNSKVALLKSVGELKDHIQNNHMDLCLHEYFVLCQTNSSTSTQPPKKFYYTLCCLCGKCFSQNSTDLVLENHRAEHHAQNEQGIQE